MYAMQYLSSFDLNLSPALACTFPLKFPLENYWEITVYYETTKNPCSVLVLLMIKKWQCPPQSCFLLTCISAIAAIIGKEKVTISNDNILLSKLYS